MVDKLTQLDLNLFVVFDRIYTERNLTRAAEHLSLTQPTVSNALARLRKTLGDPLFVKTRDGMQPTAYAESIRDSVSEALRLLTLSAQATSRFDPVQTQRIFRLSVIDLLDAAVFGFLGDVSRGETALSFRSYRVPRKELFPALASGAVDLAVDIALPDASGIERVPFSTGHYVCAMRPGHPLAAQDLTLDAYLAYPHLHVSGRRNGPGNVDVVLRQKGLKRRILVQLQSHVGAGQMVQDSDCLITVPREWAQAHGLIWRDLPMQVPPLETFIYRHRRTDGDEAVRWLQDQIAITPPVGQGPTVSTLRPR